MLKVASQRNVPPNCAETAGPNNHSPAPIDDPARRMPGPSSVFESRDECRGAGSSVETFQGGKRPAGTVVSLGELLAESAGREGTGDGAPLFAASACASAEPSGSGAESPCRGGVSALLGSSP